MSWRILFLFLLITAVVRAEPPRSAGPEFFPCGSALIRGKAGKRIVHPRSQEVILYAGTTREFRLSIEDLLASEGAWVEVPIHVFWPGAGKEIKAQLNGNPKILNSLKLNESAVDLKQKTKCQRRSK